MTKATTSTSTFILLSLFLYVGHAEHTTYLLGVTQFEVFMLFKLDNLYSVIKITF
jgi:hypothetical protein